MPKHKLISDALVNDLAKQDERREADRKKYEGKDQGQRNQIFRNYFAESIMYELKLAQKWGAEADVADNEVVCSIKDKYPLRKIGRFEKWLTSLTFTDRSRTTVNDKVIAREAIPLFQFPPVSGLKGFIFNEGGRGITLTMTRWCPFRLYVAGITLTFQKGKWSLKRR